MSNQKPGYVVAVCLLTFLLSIPSGYFFYQIGWSVFRTVWQGMPLFPSIPGFVQHQHSYSDFSYASLWRDQFVEVQPDYKKILAKPATNGFRTVMDWKVTLIDPESGASKETGWELSGEGYATKVVGDRLLLLNRNQQFEVVNDVLQPIKFLRQNDIAILLDNQIAEIHWHAKLAKFDVSRRKSDGQLVDDSFLVLPVVDQLQHPNDGPVKPYLECLCRGNQIYSFLKSGNRLYFREGLKQQKIDRDGNPIPFDGEGPETVEAEGEQTGWSLVRNETLDTEFTEQQFGTLFDGKPAALIVDEVSAGDTIGHFYSFNGTNWSKIASLPFPFGSNRFRVITRSGVQSPYIVATTSTGTGFSFVVEPPGVRQIKRSGPAETWKFVRRELFFSLVLPAIAIALSMLPGFGIWLLLARYTDPHYEFGIQSVRLASLGRRGLARLIDLAWIVFLPIAVGWIWLRDFDWLSLAESIKLKIDHPTLHTVYQALITLGILLIVEILLLVIIQGYRGITPGKWLCGLRTFRTTLRPCGLARSLAREVMLVIETLHLICWLPPMLSIALSNQRQRLGDLVSDTIVIESKSEV